MKVLFVGVFDATGRSTNNSQLVALKKAATQVYGYNYRDKAAILGPADRDEDLIAAIEKHRFDLVIYSKCNAISYDAFRKINHLTTTCLWFMDPIVSYDEEMRTKTALVDYFCCDKENVLNEALKINPKSFHVYEGFDATVDTPHDLVQVHDISFIGSLYGERKEMLYRIKKPVNIVSNAYGAEHAKMVSSTKINLNFCTGDGASDRIYKTLAAKGFLLTNDWVGREKTFIDGQEIVVFKDIDDLNEKIEYFLTHQEERIAIAEKGHQTVQQFTRESWGKRIIEIYESIK